MTEREWVENIVLPHIRKYIKDTEYNAVAHFKVPYSYELIEYNENKDEDDIDDKIEYQTDILIYKGDLNDKWHPCVIIECKVNSISTHDSITYSHKANTHKNVHPYLRYGIFLGNVDHSIPGRLIRHGVNFDFMLSWEKFKPNKKEEKHLNEIITCEYKAAEKLKEAIYNSRKSDREKYTFIHKPLNLGK